MLSIKAHGFLAEWKLLEPFPSSWMDKNSLEASKEKREKKQGSSKETRPGREATADGQLDCVVKQDGGAGNQSSATGGHPSKSQEQEEGGETAQDGHQAA